MEYFIPPKNAFAPHFVRFLILLILCLVLHFALKATLIAALILTAGFAGLIWITLRIDSIYMYIKGDRLIIKSGIFTKRCSAFSNMRLIYIKQTSPIIERAFGISNVSMHGYGTHFLFFPLSEQRSIELVLLCGVLDADKSI